MSKNKMRRASRLGPSLTTKKEKNKYLTLRNLPPPPPTPHSSPPPHPPPPPPHHPSSHHSPPCSSLPLPRATSGLSFRRRRPHLLLHFLLLPICLDVFLLPSAPLTLFSSSSSSSSSTLSGQRTRRGRCPIEQRVFP